jgi:acetolactate synthase-1/3 small subunit
MVIEVTGTTEKIDNFVELMRPFGIKEVARSGAVALVRGDQVGISLPDLDEESAGGSRPALALAAGGTDTTGDI